MTRAVIVIAMQWIKILGFSMILIVLLSVAGALSQIFTPHRTVKLQPKRDTESARVVAKVTPRCIPAGCSSHICAEESEVSNIVTTCDFKDEYMCYKDATCERQENGHCGWTPTPTLNTCLKNPPPVAQSASVELVY